MLADVQRAKIVITNYHAFRLRERVELSWQPNSSCLGAQDLVRFACRTLSGLERALHPARACGGVLAGKVQTALNLAQCGVARSHLSRLEPDVATERKWILLGWRNVVPL